ncbi:MAG TPA: hypothetical protein VEC36_11130, partial [Patescibacteria group bacterium]|nr:hypothetical protein [Patescibacteria group bacterium]
MDINNHSKNGAARDSYFELSEHSAIQVITFLVIMVSAAAAFFNYVAIPGLYSFFKSFMNATITQTALYTEWAVLAFPETAGETEYW